MSEINKPYPRTRKSFLECMLVGLICSSIQIVFTIITYPKSFESNIIGEIMIVICLTIFFFFARTENKKDTEVYGK